jgi:hypothetical protein
MQLLNVKAGGTYSYHRTLKGFWYFVYAYLCLTVTVKLLEQIIPNLGLKQSSGYRSYIHVFH